MIEVVIENDSVEIFLLAFGGLWLVVANAIVLIGSVVKWLKKGHWEE